MGEVLAMLRLRRAGLSSQDFWCEFEFGFVLMLDDCVVQLEGWLPAENVNPGFAGTAAAGAVGVPSSSANSADPADSAESAGGIFSFPTLSASIFSSIRLILSARSSASAANLALVGNSTFSAQSLPLRSSIRTSIGAR